MQDIQEHTLFVAHSNKNYVLGLTIGLREKGFLIAKHTVSGIKALEYILYYQPKIAIIEAELPLLSAFDIIETVKRKEIKTQFIVILKTRELPMLEPLQYVKINEVYYCNMSVKTILKVLFGMNKNQNWFWNFIDQKFKKISCKKMKIVETLSSREIAILLSLADVQNVKAIKMDTTEKLINDSDLNVIAFKLNLMQQQTSLKEWCIKNNVILRAFSLRSTA